MRRALNSSAPGIVLRSKTGVIRGFYEDYIGKTLLTRKRSLSSFYLSTIGCHFANLFRYVNVINVNHSTGKIY
jgi:hypothetical protein